MLASYLPRPVERKDGVLPRDQVAGFSAEAFCELYFSSIMLSDLVALAEPSGFAVQQLQALPCISTNSKSEGSGDIS